MSITPPTYAEKFTDIAGSISETFGLAGYSFSDDRGVKVSRAEAAGSDFAIRTRGTLPAKLTPAPVSVRYLISFTAGDASSLGTANAAFNTIAAKCQRIGYGKLYRKLPDNSEQWCLAEYTGGPQYDINDPFAPLVVVLHFDRLSHWYATSATAPTASTISASPTTITVANPGNYEAVGEANLIIRLRSNAINGWGSSLLIENVTKAQSVLITGHAASTANYEIKLDCNAHTVLLSTDNGATYPTSVWPDTALGAHKGLPTLEVGNNSWRFTTNVSPNFDAEFSFYAAY